MASTRKSPFSSLQDHVAARLRATGLPPGASLLAGLSGGVDSVVLLTLLRDLAPAMRFSLRALHVNHGISPNAGQWQAFCERLCRDLGVPFAAERVDIAPYRALGLEGADDLEFGHVSSVRRKRGIIGAEAESLMDGET